MGEKIKITFLGSGSAIPTERRNHPSFVLEYKDEMALFDCGEGTQRQFRKAKINPCRLTRVFISHWHADHVLGLPGLLQTLAMNNYNKELKLYGPEGSKNFFSVYESLFINKINPIKVKIFEMKNSSFEENDFIVKTREMNHNCPCIAFSFQVKDKMRINKNKLKKIKIPNSPLIRDLLKGKTINLGGKKIDGKKIAYKEKGKKVVYIPDTKKNKNISELIKNSELVISECSYSSKEKKLAEEHFHLTAEEISKIAKKKRVKELVLFHLSQRYDKDNREVLNEAKKNFNKTKIAEDFDVFYV